MRVLSIANFKGGTGKTVTACNVAAILAELGHRVILIDADPQHNTTDFYLPPDAVETRTLFDVLTGYGEPVWHDNLTPTGREGLELLPGSMDLLRLDLATIADGSSDALRRMQDFLGAVRANDGADFVIFDCPPSFSAASVAALFQSDDVIIPTRTDAFSRAGVAELLAQIRTLGRAAVGVKCRVLVTMADRSNLSRQGAQLLRESGLWVFAAEIRTCVKVGESTYARQPLTEYSPRCSAAMDYKMLVSEYLDTLKKEAE